VKLKHVADKLIAFGSHKKDDTLSKQAIEHPIHFLFGIVQLLSELSLPFYPLGLSAACQAPRSEDN